MFEQVRLYLFQHPTINPYDLQAKAQVRMAKTLSQRRKPGRPQGSKNKNRAEVLLTSELRRIQAMIQATLPLLAGWLSLTYLVLDSHFGNHNALQMVLQCGLHLLSKMRSDGALCFPYVGSQPRRGPRRK